MAKLLKFLPDEFKTKEDLCLFLVLALVAAFVFRPIITAVGQLILNLAETLHVLALSLLTKIFGSKTVYDVLNFIRGKQAKQTSTEDDEEEKKTTVSEDTNKPDGNAKKTQQILDRFCKHLLRKEKNDSGEPAAKTE